MCDCITEEKRAELKKDLQVEILSLLDGIIEEELSVICGSTVGLCAREVLLQSRRIKL